MSKSNVLVECDVLHMYTRQEVKVRVGVLEWVDHVVRHIRASPCPAVYPPAQWKDNQSLQSRVVYAHTCATSVANTNSSAVYQAAETVETHSPRTR